MKKNILNGIIITASIILCSVNLFAQCNNVTSGGTVSADQSGCGSFNPANITNSIYPSGGTGTLQYQWQSSPNGTTWTDIAGATLESYDPSTITVTTYYHRTSRRSGCTTYDGVSNYVIKAVDPIPTAGITAGGPVTFCSPGNVILSANAAAGTTYQWRKDNINISGATLQTYTATTTGSYRVVKTVTATGCFAVSNAITVTVHAPLATTVTELGFNQCGASNVILEAQNVIGYSYQWYEDANLIPNSTNYQLVTGHNGTYSCTITNTCGTYPSLPFALNNSWLSMFPYGYINANGSTSICTGQSVTLSEVMQGFSGYQWYRNNQSHFVLPG